VSRLNVSNFAWAIGVIFAVLGLHFYYVREIVASMVLFSVMFFSVGLAVLTVFFIWYAGNRIVVWARPADVNAAVLPRPLASHAKS